MTGIEYKAGQRRNPLARCAGWLLYVGVAVFGVAPGSIVLGQAPPASASLDARAITDLQAVIRQLDAAVRANRNDAAAWHRRGMVAWALANRAEAEPRVRGLDGISLRRMADTSLRIAAQIAPADAMYRLAVGEFLRTGDETTSRMAAIPFFDEAVRIARTGTDKAVLARAAASAGRAYWLRYDMAVWQVPLLTCKGIPPSLDSATILRPVPQEPIIGYLSTEHAIKDIHNKLINCHRPAPDGGDADYLRAEALFREAYDAVSDERTFRQLAMVYAERHRWRELERLARDRITRSQDALAWFTLGLALQRIGNRPQALAVFDTGTSRMSAMDRARLLAFDRLLDKKDSALYAQSAPDARSRWEQSFWWMSDPLWSREGNDTRAEFCARVAFADLRWTVEEMGVRGADSDRGKTYIRYGPPDRIVAIRGCNSSNCPYRAVCKPGGNCPRPLSRDDEGRTVFLTDTEQAVLPGLSDVVTYWDYDIGMVFIFWGAPTFGTARYAFNDVSHVQRVNEILPASFDNVASERILNLPTRIARFRAAGDSVDIHIGLSAPGPSIREPVANAPVILDTWVLGRTGAGEQRDSSMLGATGVERKTFRVAPSQYLIRIEASSPGTMVAARAMQWLTAGRDSTSSFNTRGFGVSDLLLATNAQPIGAAPSRWRDFSFTPVIDAVVKGSTVDIIWENYALTPGGADVRYSVAVTLQRERSASGRIAAALVGFAAGVVGVNRSTDRITSTFERSMPASPTIVDRVSLALADTPAGDYRITLEITDRANGQKTSTTTRLTIQ